VGQIPKEPIMEMDIVAQLKEGHGFGEQLSSIAPG